VALLTRRNWDGKTRQSRQEWFVISPTLERSSLTKLAKMANCSESCQQFTVKHGVARLPLSQFAKKETKGSPMVA
jgi:hypothetical protein